MSGKVAKKLRKQVRSMLQERRKDKRLWFRGKDPIDDFTTVYRRIKKLYVAGVYV